MSESVRTVLEAHGVRKRFDENQVLTGVDLTILEGEILMLMGSNGAGKSVLTSCLTGSVRPDTGRIELFDGLSPRDARPLFSIMMQGRMADPDLTGHENLQFYGSLHPNGTNSWQTLVERLELESELDRPVAEYSGGMERKLEIAITLSVDVPLYFLDEPTAELDLAMIQELHDIVLEQRDAGKTIVVTSHAPLDAQIAERIAFLRDGEIVADGRPEALFESVPPVLRVRGAVPPATSVVGERLFQRGDEVRGFLPDEDALGRVRDQVDERGNDVLVEIDRPSYTDLFNYYTYVQENARPVGKNAVQCTDGGQ
ncbi:ABC transporter ATP-binding protein [Natronobiforma cellulositropha]|uniref:ABC transporter ATP-binding protein n=1 Tax=Natronobiforma cellulositropha TaxID=1679076 RepID=UPI0021D5B86B|nr:ABC transporter ATP-binding protein [Natronobiforma cellulositropha]